MRLRKDGPAALGPHEPPPRPSTNRSQRVRSASAAAAALGATAPDEGHRREVRARRGDSLAARWLANHPSRCTCRALDPTQAAVIEGGDACAKAMHV